MTIPRLIEVVTEDADRLSDCSSRCPLVDSPAMTGLRPGRLQQPRLSPGGGLVAKPPRPARREGLHEPMFILGIDHPMVDVTAEVDDDFIERYNVPIGSACLASKEQLPLYDELLSMPNVKFSPGGTTLNTIRVAHWILGGTRAGTGYMGAVGPDKLGDYLIETIRAEGIVDGFMRAESPTAQCASCLKRAERGLVTNLGAANEYTVQHLLEHKEILRQAGIVYSTAFFFNCFKGESIWTAAEECRMNKSIFAFNLGAPYLMQRYADEFNRALGLCDIVFGNELEALEYAKANGLSDASPEGVVKALARAPMEKPGLRTAIITQGAEKTVLARSDGVYLEVPVPVVRPVVDTNAAGDAFVGGYLAGVATGENLWTCVEMAHKAAGHIIQHTGCTFEGRFADL